MKLSSLAFCVGLSVSLPALADTTCNARLVNRNNGLIQSFNGYGYNDQAACANAMQQCQGQLNYLHSQGRNPDARCVLNYNQPRPQPQPFPQPPRRQSFVDMTCSSVGHRFQTCPVAGGRRTVITNVQLLRQISTVPCIKGTTFGVSQGALWTNLGCRGLFRVHIQGNAFPGGPIRPFDSNENNENSEDIEITE